MDEIEKAFSGMSGGDTSGVTTRLFGQFLTWMQDKKGSSFIVATANNISMLPPEFLRKGRFDEIFFVDLPSEIEREEIFKIHLEKRNRDSKKYEVKELSRKTHGFSGSEIEAVVETALCEAYYNGNDLSSDEIIKAAKEMIPLSKTMENEVNVLREWAGGRAKNASSSDKSLTELMRSKMRVDLN